MLSAPKLGPWEVPLPTSERTISGFVNRLVEVLPDALGEADSSNTKRMKFTVLLRSIGLSRRSQKTLAELDVALKQARVFCDHPLVEAGPQRVKQLRFSKAPFPPEEMLFATEADLKRFVMAQIGNAGPLKSLVLLAEEVQIGPCRLDLLCEEPSRRGRPLVVIEFKKGAGSDRLAGQLARYVDTIRRQPEYATRPIKVIVITAGKDDAVPEVMRIRNVEVECYRYEVKLQRASDVGEGLFS